MASLCTVLANGFAIKSVHAQAKSNGKPSENAAQTYAKLLQDTKTANEEYIRIYQDYANFNGDEDARKKLASATDAELEKVFQLAKQAMKIAPDNAAGEDIAFLRYTLSTYYAMKKRFFEAIVFASSASVDGKDVYAQRGAVIELKSYMQLKNEINNVKKRNPAQAAQIEPDLNFIRGRIEQIAHRIVTNWNESEEADQARLILVSSAVEDGNFVEAKKNVDLINPKKPLRISAELLLGTHATQRYYNLKYGKDAATNATANAQDLITLQPIVTDMLPKALAEAQKKQLDVQGVLGAYLYLRLLLKENRGQEGLPLINDPKEGLLVKIQNGSADIPDAYAFDMIRTIFQIYLRDNKTTDAIKLLDILEKRAGTDAEQRKLLNNFLIVTGSEILTQAKAAQADEDSEKAQSIAGGLEILVGKINPDALSQDVKLMYWLADAHSNLGDIIAEKANEHFEKAGKILGQIVAMGEKDAKSIAPFTPLAIKMKQIELTRSRKEFAAAIDMYKEILSSNPNIMLIQKEAAKSLQMMAFDSSSGSSDRMRYYTHAIMGVPEKSGTPIVWGWSKIARTIYSDKKFGDKPETKSLFFEVRFHLAQCRYLAAMEFKEEDKKNKQLNAAKDLIIQDHNEVDKNLGGEERKKAYERLLTDIQKALGQDPIGLKEATDKSAASPAAS